MWWNAGPHLRRRMNNIEAAAIRHGERKSIWQQEENIKVKVRTSLLLAENNAINYEECLAQDQARKDVAELLEVLRKKFGSMTKAWRIGLDTDSSGALDFSEFCNALKRLGYVGNIRTLFYNLDVDDSGSISLRELAPHCSDALEKFRYLATRKCGTIENMWNVVLDLDRSGTVSLEEFRENVKVLGYSDEEEIEVLYELLELRRGSSYLTLDDIHFLQGWDDTRQASHLRLRNGSSWVNKDPYLREKCTRPGMNDVAGEYSNMVAVDMTEKVHEFKAFLINRYGSLCIAFDAMDGNMSGALSLTEFQTVVSSVVQYCKPSEAKRLFLTLNQDPGGVVTKDELGIRPDEWTRHRQAKKVERLGQLAQKRHNALAPLGHTPRQQNATSRHASRIRMPEGNTGEVAFGSPVPKGWSSSPPQGLKWASLTSSAGFKGANLAGTAPLSARVTSTGVQNADATKLPQSARAPLKGGWMPQALRPL